MLQEKINSRVALPEATPSRFGTATLLLAALGGQTSSAPRNKPFANKTDASSVGHEF